MTGSITVNNLTGAITVAHIHEGLAGLTGGVIIGLEPDGTNAEQMNVPTGTTLSQAQMDAMFEQALGELAAMQQVVSVGDGWDQMVSAPLPPGTMSCSHWAVYVKKYFIPPYQG